MHQAVFAESRGGLIENLFDQAFRFGEDFVFDQQIIFDQSVAFHVHANGLFNCLSLRIPAQIVDHQSFIPFVCIGVRVGESFGADDEGCGLLRRFSRERGG